MEKEKTFAKNVLVYVPHGFGCGVVQAVEDGEAVVVLEDGDRRLIGRYPVGDLRLAYTPYRPFRVRSFRAASGNPPGAYIHESGVADWFTEILPQIAIMPREAYPFEGGVKIFGD